MRKLLIWLRGYFKFLIIVFISTLIIMALVVSFYKPIYKVTLNDEMIGYCSKKSIIQEQIDKYIEQGDGNNKNIAFVQINEMPTYEMCLLKRGITTNDNEIIEKIKSQGIAYYKYYAILDEDEEKVYVSDFTTAENIVNTLREKDSENIENIKILEKYETELKDFSQQENAVAALYKEKIKEEIIVAKVAKNDTGNRTSFSTASNISRTNMSIGISFIKPVTGTISSRFGSVSRVRSSVHTGLDIAASKGTTIKAAASGTVTFSGTKGAYGKLVVITHSNGVQTHYGHCSSLYVSEGQYVTQGEKIAAVGSTGNSTGPHLHFEVRVNGIAYNPQNYVY